MRRYIGPLNSRNFRLLWVGEGVSQVGNQVYYVALIWLITDLTGSTGKIGLVLTIDYAPTLLLTVFSGIWSDTLGPRRVLVLANAVGACLTAIFATVVALRHSSLAAVSAFALSYGLTISLWGPAFSAFLPSVIDVRNGSASNALWQLASQGAALIGPAVGGWFIVSTGVTGALAFDTATFILAAVTISAIHQQSSILSDGTSKSSKQEQRGVSGHLRDAIAFLRSKRGMLAIVVLFSLTNGLNDVQVVLMPVLARAHLHMSASQFGITVACIGVGKVSGSLAMMRGGDLLHRRAFVICAGQALLGLSIIGMGASSGAWMLYIASFLFGLAFIIPEIVSVTLWQQLIPKQLMGRVFALMGTVAMAMNPIGLIVAGLLGQIYGVRLGLAIGGSAILALGLAAYLLPAVRAIDRYRHSAASNS